MSHKTLNASDIIRMKSFSSKIIRSGDFFSNFRIKLHRLLLLEKKNIKISSYPETFRRKVDAVF